MKVALITAGGAGMFCGSCMQDNTLVRALRMAGSDAVLIPTYTPITVDEDDVSTGRVFMGGINVYLDSMLPGWRLLPRILKRPLDHPGLVRLLSRFSSSTDASKLGPLTIDMLRGNSGPQQQEVRELCKALVREIKPDAVIFSNALLSGLIPELRSHFDGAVHVLLQGDDIFLNALPESHRDRAIQLLRQNCESVDLFLTHSLYYADYMAQALGLPIERMRQIPLSLDMNDHDFSQHEDSARDDLFTIGYFARICPEKGIHRLLEAAPKLLAEIDDARIVVAGYLPELHRRWFQRQFNAVRNQCGAERIEWLGSPEQRHDKLRIFRAMDVLCLPTEYHEPKGLPVLEAAFVGVPAALPRHGAFPERIETLGAGFLYEPNDQNDLIRVLAEAAADRQTLPTLQHSLRTQVRNHHAMEATGAAVLKVLSTNG